MRKQEINYNTTKIYTVANAHLDTVWRWNLAKTIDEYLPDTIAKNFDLIEKYSSYKFNFEGAYRYQLIEEYYPLAFEKIKQYVKDDRWYPAGAEYENGDVNIPSPEGLWRNILYGQKYFSDKFSKKSNSLFLPDCFGFNKALPTIAGHADLIGMTTQKLSWGSASGVPFNLGVWKGISGDKMLACLNPGSYRYKFSGDLRSDSGVALRLYQNKNTKANIDWAINLYGTGDVGGAPSEQSVMAVHNAVDNNTASDSLVISSSTDQMFSDISQLPDRITEKLPIWKGEFLMTSHGAGAYTSRAMSKTLNSECEKAAYIAEFAATSAAYLGLKQYNYDELEDAWKRVIKHQFHDDITGTSNMDVYNDAWDDYYTSLNQFKNEFYSSCSAIIKELDTTCMYENSTPIVVVNPSRYQQLCPVEGWVYLKENCTGVTVINKKDQIAVPCNILERVGKRAKISIFTHITPFTFAVYEIIPKQRENIKRKGDRVWAKEHSLENRYIKIVFNKNGDIAKIYCKSYNNAQLLSSPIKMALLHDTGSLAYPSWEITKEDIDREPYLYANTPEFKVLENDGTCGKIEIKRNLGESTITQIVSLPRNSRSISVKNIVDWKSRRSMLKAVFPLNFSNEYATYDVGVGYVKRTVNSKKRYEVPAHKWADLSSSKSNLGLMIMCDTKHGWDMPKGNTLRMTCLHTPAGAFTKETRQDLQDLGRNEFTFHLIPHMEHISKLASRETDKLLYPPCFFAAGSEHKGSLGREFRLFEKFSNNNGIKVHCVKKSEYDDAIIVRMTNYRPDAFLAEQRYSFSKTVEDCYYVNLYEEKVDVINERTGKSCNIKLSDNNKIITFSIPPLSTVSLKIKFKNAFGDKKKSGKTTAVELPFNARGFTSDDEMKHIILQASGISIPRELIKPSKTICDIPFEFPQVNRIDKDVLVCRGETINLPRSAKRVYFIAASTLSDINETFNISGIEQKITIHSMFDPIGQWDMVGLNQHHKVKNTDLALEFTHAHHPEGNIANKKLKFFLYSFPVGSKKFITLPENNHLIILAMTTSTIKEVIRPNKPFYEIPQERSNFEDIPLIDKVADKADFVTIRAGKIQDQINGGKGKGFKRDNIVTNIIRSYTKSEW